MNPEEYANLERLDRTHWFYRGKHAIVRHWIDHHAPLQRDDVLVDAGMGTGTWLMKMSRRCRLVGLDDHDESLAIARPRLEAVGGRAIKTKLDRVDLPDGSASVVTLMDVLEHLPDDSAALREMVRITRPGGLIVLTVPALKSLWSDWDVSLHHYRRYHRRELMKLFSTVDVDVLRCAYFNSLAVAPITLIRTWRKFRPPREGAIRAENRIPGRALNALLYSAMVIPARWRWFYPPLGVSLLGVLRRRG